MIPSKTIAGVVITLWAVGALAEGPAPAVTPESIDLYNKLFKLVACAGGAYSSFSFGEAVQPRSRMFHLFIACIIMGASFTAVVNAAILHFTDFQLVPEVQAGMGAIISCLARFYIPAIIERIGPWLDKIPFLRKRESKNDDAG